MDNNFDSILEQVRREWNAINCERERVSFLAKFENWRRCRLRTLSALQLFLDEYQRITPLEIHLDNGARAIGDVGKAVGALGLLAAGAGWFMTYSPNWKEWGKFFMDYGLSFTVGGGGVASFAGLVNAGFSEYILSEVKTALEEDRRHTNELLPWFKRVKKLDRQLREVFGCGIGNMRNIVIAIREILVIISRGGIALNNLRSCLSEVMMEELSVDNLPNLDDERLENIIHGASYEMRRFFRELCDNPEVQAAARRLMDSVSNCYLDSSHIIVIINLIFKGAVRIEKFLSKFSSAEREYLQSLIDQASRKALQAIFCTSGVFNFLASLKDLINGTSPHFRMVENTRQYLFEEYNDLDDSFSALENRD